MSEAPTSGVITYNREDFVALAGQIRQRRMQLYRRIAAVFVGLMVLTLALNWLVGLDLPWWQAGLGLLAAALLWGLASPQVQGRLIQHTARRAGLLHPQSFTAADEGFEARSDTGHSLLKWSAVHSIEVEDSRLFVFASRDSAYIIPSRAFAADAEFETFVLATRECWKMHHRL